MPSRLACKHIVYTSKYGRWSRVDLILAVFVCTYLEFSKTSVYNRKTKVTRSVSDDIEPKHTSKVWEKRGLILEMKAADFLKKPPTRSSHASTSHPNAPPSYPTVSLPTQIPFIPATPHQSLLELTVRLFKHRSFLPSSLLLRIYQRHQNGPAVGTVLQAVGAILAHLSPLPGRR